MEIRNKGKRTFYTTVLMLMLFFITIGCSVESGVHAEPTLNISIYKNFGYSAFGDIQGKFAITARSEDVAFVEFYLDDKLQLNSTVIPHKWSFDTDNYPLGNHVIRVVAFNSHGESVMVSRQTNFVSSDISRMFAIFGVVVVVVVVVLITISVIIARRNRGLGLTKCPNCGYVFYRTRSMVHYFSIYQNSCPKCGKTFWAKNIKGLESK